MVERASMHNLRKFSTSKILGYIVASQFVLCLYICISQKDTNFKAKRKSDHHEKDVQIQQVPLGFGFPRFPSAGTGFPSIPFPIPGIPTSGAEIPSIPNPSLNPGPVIPNLGPVIPNPRPVIPNPGPVIPNFEPFIDYPGSIPYLPNIQQLSANTNQLGTAGNSKYKYRVKSATIVLDGAC